MEKKMFLLAPDDQQNIKRIIHANYEQTGDFISQSAAVRKALQIAADALKLRKTSETVQLESDRVPA